jgi:proteasome lid subunit RPN8/RPN11
MESSDILPKENAMPDNKRTTALSLAASVLFEMEMHALSKSEEVCGFVYPDHYQPLENVLKSSRAFYADPAQLARTLSLYGEPPAIFHTHPGGNPELSEADRKLWYYKNSTMIVGCVRDGQLRWKMYGNRGD